MGITSHCGISSRILPEQCKTDSGDKPTCCNHLRRELEEVGVGGVKLYVSLENNINH